MAPGITRDPRGTQDTPKTNTPGINEQVRKLQAQDERHLADLREQAAKAKR